MSYFVVWHEKGCGYTPDRDGIDCYRKFEDAERAMFEAWDSGDQAYIIEGTAKRYTTDAPSYAAYKAQKEEERRQEASRRVVDRIMTELEKQKSEAK